MNAAIEFDGKTIKPEPGARDFGAGNLNVSYALSSAGRKTIRFEDERVRVQTEHPGNFLESVPLLVREEDRVRIEGKRVLLERGGRIALTIEFDPAATAELSNRGDTVGPYQILTVRLKAADRLWYAMVIRRSR